MDHGLILQNPFPNLISIKRKNVSYLEHFYLFLTQ